MVSRFFVIVIMVMLGISMSEAALPTVSGTHQPGQQPGLTEVEQDTVVAVLVVPADIPAPEFVNVLPDTIDFGGVAYLILDFPAGSEPVDSPGYTFNEGWVVPAEESSSAAAVDLSQLPEPGGPRVIFPVRIYQLSPFQIAGASGLSRVIFVRGKVENLEDAAPIRSPRLWGLQPAQLILISSLLLALLLLFFWYWRRRRALPPAMQGYDQNPVAWPAAAMDLLALHQGGLLDLGKNREFLSQLAWIARTYVAGRFLVGAREMTGKEIELACLAQGYELTTVRPFTILIRRIDQLRYNPEVLPAALCRTEFSSLVGILKTARISSDHTSIPAADLIAGQQAWAQLAPFSEEIKGGS